MFIVHAKHCISQLKPHCFTLRITYWLIVDGENENFDTVRAVSIWKMILKFSINHFTLKSFEFVNYPTPLWYSVMWIWARFLYIEDRKYLWNFFCIFPAGIYGLIIFYGSSLSLESDSESCWNVFPVIWSLPSLLNSKANFQLHQNWKNNRSRLQNHDGRRL